LRDSFKRWALRLAAPLVPVALAAAAFTAPAAAFSTQVVDCGNIPSDTHYYPCGDYSQQYIQHSPNYSILENVEFNATHSWSNYWAEFTAWDANGTLIGTYGPWHWQNNATCSTQPGGCWHAVWTPPGTVYVLAEVNNVAGTTDHYWSGIIY